MGYEFFEEKIIFPSAPVPGINNDQFLIGRNSKARCLFRPNFLKQVVIEIQNMAHPVKNFQSTPQSNASEKVIRVRKRVL